MTLDRRCSARSTARRPAWSRTAGGPLTGFRSPGATARRRLDARRAALGGSTLDGLTDRQGGPLTRLPVDRRLHGLPGHVPRRPRRRRLRLTQAFQSIGLGLATAIGAAVARPGRLTVAALGDGGLLNDVADLETAVRLGLDLLVVVYDDEAYGAEVHHFGPDGYPLDHVTFPPADIAGIGRGFGCAAVTVRAPADLDAVAALRSPARATARWSWTRRWPAANRRGGWPKPSAATDGRASRLLVSRDQRAEHAAVAQQVQIADVLLADTGVAGLPDPRRQVRVAEQEAGR